MKIKFVQTSYGNGVQILYNTFLKKYYQLQHHTIEIYEESHNTFIWAWQPI